jgi:hypothetical protein
VILAFEIYTFVIIQQIGQLKAHISELNLHAEAQASEYKQKVCQQLRFVRFHSSPVRKLDGMYRTRLCSAVKRCSFCRTSFLFPPRVFHNYVNYQIR